MNVFKKRGARAKGSEGQNVASLPGGEQVALNRGALYRAYSLQ